MENSFSQFWIWWDWPLMSQVTKHLSLLQKINFILFWAFILSNQEILFWSVVKRNFENDFDFPLSLFNLWYSKNSSKFSNFKNPIYWRFLNKYYWLLLSSVNAIKFWLAQSGQMKWLLLYLFAHFLLAQEFSQSFYTKTSKSWNWRKTGNLL